MTKIPQNNNTTLNLLNISSNLSKKNLISYKFELDINKNNKHRVEKQISVKKIPVKRTLQRKYINALIDLCKQACITYNYGETYQRDESCEKLERVPEINAREKNWAFIYRYRDRTPSRAGRMSELPFIFYNHNEITPNQ